MRTLVGGGVKHGGFDALDYSKIIHDGDAWKFWMLSRDAQTQASLAWGLNSILAVLPDKLARVVYEFHDFSIRDSEIESLKLPPLPADQSDFDVHGALGIAQVTKKGGYLLNLLLGLIKFVLSITSIIFIILRPKLLLISVLFPMAGIELQTKMLWNWFLCFDYYTHYTNYGDYFVR